MSFRRAHGNARLPRYARELEKSIRRCAVLACGCRDLAVSSLEEAIALPRIGDDHTDLIIYEDRIPPKTIERLKAMGHPVQAYPGWHRIMGSVNGCVLLEDGTLLLQTYWEMDGMPWVSYGWYQKIG